MARALVPAVEACGYEAWLESAWEREEIVVQADTCSLLITLGGDGTILRVVRASLSTCADAGPTTPPLLTIDFGTLGFLAELSPGDAEQGVRQVLSAKEHWIEERKLLRAVLLRDGRPVVERDALNEVVLARADGPHAIRLTLAIDGAHVARYTADALIVASPTGSTAYAQGAGGPILGPTVDGILIVPVAPHFAIARSFVVPGSSRVQLQATTPRSTVVSVDGQINFPYESGDVLHVSQSAATARFVRTGATNYFYATFQDKLQRA
jgi:NAD+ kinase